MHYKSPRPAVLNLTILDSPQGSLKRRNTAPKAPSLENLVQLLRMDWQASPGGSNLQPSSDSAGGFPVFKLQDQELKQLLRVLLFSPTERRVPRLTHSSQPNAITLDPFPINQRRNGYLSLILFCLSLMWGLALFSRLQTS